MAVDKNKSYMGRRYVEVFRAKKLVSGSPEAISSSNGSNSATGGAHERSSTHAGADSSAGTAGRLAIACSCRGVFFSLLQQTSSWAAQWGTLVPSNRWRCRLLHTHGTIRRNSSRGTQQLCVFGKLCAGWYSQ
jgi:hypothetical protein